MESGAIGVDMVNVIKHVMVAFRRNLGNVTSLHQRMVANLVLDPKDILKFATYTDVQVSEILYHLIFYIHK